MNEFTASNGVRVYLDDNGDMDIDNSGRVALCGGLIVEAIREFFRAEEDARLGRWRYDDDITVRVTGAFIRVENHRDATYSLYWADGRKYSIGEYGLGVAAAAYLDAHPEPKPEWHDALVISWKEGPKALLPHVALRDPRDNGDNNLGWHVDLNYSGASWHSRDRLVEAIGDAEVTILVPKSEVAS